MDKNISLASNVKLMRTLILATFLYACETWTLTAKLERRIQALEMICNRRLLNISYKNHVTNEDVRSRIQNATGVHDDLLTMVKKRKLRWYGHISRSSGTAKTIVQGTVKGASGTAEEMGIMCEALDDHEGSVSIGGWLIPLCR